MPVSSASSLSYVHMSRLIYGPAHQLQLQTPRDDQQCLNSNRPGRAQCEQGWEDQPVGHVHNEWYATSRQIAVMTCWTWHACAINIVLAMHVFSLQWEGLGTACD